MKLVPALSLLVVLVAAQASATNASPAAATAAASEVRAASDGALQAAVAGDWRTDEEKARDRYRHPVESLTFWGLKPGMILLEVQPGAGWWTDILAPYARLTGGKLYVTAADLSNPKTSEGSRKARAEFEARYAAKPDVFGQLHYVDWGPATRKLPADTFDFILTARSVHNWMEDAPGTVEAIFREFHQALKPGGILAVEQHRAKPDGGSEQPSTGYVSEKYVIDQAQKAGFRLAARSQINANPKDTRDHPFGVWTLPPSLRSAPYGARESDPNFDHSKYLAIGESDRMTLRFVK